MKTRLRAAIAAIVALAAAACLTAGPAGATHGDLYCLNGQTTTLPAGVAYSGGSANLSAATAHTIVTVGGTFWAGFLPSFNRSGLWVSSTPPPPGTFAPGFSTNFVALGACTVTGPPPVRHIAVCKLLPRADGTTGLFQAIQVPDWNDPKGQYFDAPAANWVEGLGLTCDNPVALGYRAAGYNVSWGGKQAPDHDARGVRGSGFNNIYPYFTR